MGSSAHAHYNQVLTNLSVEYRPPALKAREIMRPFKVEKESDVFPIWDKTGFDVEDDVRADGAPENQTTLGWTYSAYQIEGHGLKDKVTKRMLENADSGLQLEASKAANIKQKVLNGLEDRILGSGQLLRTAANNGGSANISWATITTASPRSNFDTATNAIWLATGKVANTAVLAIDVAKIMTSTSEYRDEFKYVNDTRSSSFMIPSGTYGIENWIIVPSLTNSAIKGQAKSLGSPMSDDIWVGYVDPSPGLGVLTYGLLLYTEEYARKWWDDEYETWWIAYNYNYAPKIIDKNCGYLLTSVKT